MAESKLMFIEHYRALLRSETMRILWTRRPFRKTAVLLMPLYGVQCLCRLDCRISSPIPVKSALFWSQSAPPVEPIKGNKLVQSNHQQNPGHNEDKTWATSLVHTSLNRHTFLLFFKSNMFSATITWVIIFLLLVISMCSPDRRIKVVDKTKEIQIERKLFWFESLAE